MSRIQRIKGVFQQWWFSNLHRRQPHNDLLKDETTIILKSRRTEYTYEYFGDLYNQKIQQDLPTLSVKEFGDENFIAEMQTNSFRYLI